MRPTLLLAFALLLVTSSAWADLDLDAISTSDGAAYASRAGGGREKLTVDPRLQAEVERLLRTSRAPEAAIVVVDVKRGSILAWATDGSDHDLVRTPMFPAASLNKVVTAATALEAGEAYRGTKLCFSGGLRGLATHDIERMCLPGEPRVAFGEALGRSINVIFGRLAAHRLDPGQLATMAGQLGFDGRVPFDLTVGESHVVFPDDALGRARAAAGFQRSAEVSPLAAAFTMATIARDGVRPRLFIRAASGPADAGRAMKSSTAHALQRMLRVTTRRGTSRKAFRHRDGRPNIPAAGKTGTLGIGKPHRLLSWFAGFAPADDPEIAVAVLLANDLKWWRKANQVARDVFDAHFELKARDEG